jgi:hypothetical protein
MIEKGFCECGCGERTNIARQTRNETIKGDPYRFRVGHWLRGRSGERNPSWKGGKIIDDMGYISLYLPNHPKSRGESGRIREHMVIAEKILGKPLIHPHEVHHPFGKLNNSVFVICENRQYHFILERRGRALKSCGHAHWRKCPYCKQWDDPKNMYIKKERHSYHRSCRNIYRQKLKLRNSNKIFFPSKELGLK